MKNYIDYILKFLVLSFLLSVIGIAYAFQEPTQPPPQGNAPAPLNVSEAGQSKAGGLILNTDGAPIGLIVQQGNVGIGTTNPQSRLEINAGGLTGPGGWNKAIHFTNPDNSAITLTNPAKGGLLFGMHGADQAFYFSRFNTDNSFDKHVMTIQADSGKVGIGTTSPAHQLEVQDFSPRIGIDNRNVGGFAEFITMQADQNKWSIGSLGDSNSGGSGNNGFYIYQYTDYLDQPVNKYRMTITDSGNVGIGINKPVVPLDVQALSGGSGLRILSSDNQNLFGVSESGIGGEGAAFLMDSNGVIGILLRGGSSSAFWHDVNVIGGGKVGIGTTSPTQSLDVAGAVRLRGHLIDVNNSSGSNGQVLIRTAAGVAWQAPTAPPELPKVLWGRIRDETGNPVIDYGSGFSVSYDGNRPGVYRITFNQPFNSIPAVTAIPYTQWGQGPYFKPAYLINVINITNSYFEIQLWSWNGAAWPAANGSFSFAVFVDRG